MAFMKTIETLYVIQMYIIVRLQEKQKPFPYTMFPFSLVKNLPFGPRCLFCMFIISISIVLAFGCRPQSLQKKPGTLYVRLKKNPSTLDPALIVDLDGARIAAKLYGGLVTFDERLAPIPDLAASWTTSPDGRVFNFQLKQDLHFYNGREVTVDDIIYSFERVLNPATRSPRTWVFERISGARQYMAGRAAHVTGLHKKGLHELSITLDEPFAPFLSFLGLTTAYIVPREDIEAWGQDYGFHGSGTGPFVLKQWRHNQYLVLEANDAYYGGKPCLARIYYKIVPEDFTALVEFEKGGIDLLPEIMASEYDRFAHDPAWQPYMQQSPSLNTYYLGLNCQVQPYTDVRVRQALHFAIDKEKILKTVLGGRGIPARGPLPPLLSGAEVREQYSYDPIRAKALLKQAGYPNGFSMTLYQVADTETLDICQAVQDYLKNVGITVNIVQLEWSTFLETVARGDAPSFWLSWWADYPDGENFLFPLFHSRNWGPGGNRCRFKSPKIDDLIMQALSITDEKKRRVQYQFIEKKIIDESPLIWCWHKSVASIHQPRVEGLSIPPLAVMEKFENVCVQ